ncbi:MAG: PqqD family protein [Desulfosarcinaceae bacterium]
MGYQLAEDYLWKEVGGQVVILHFDSGRYYSLNDSGSAIWKGLLADQTEDQIVSGLRAAFDVEADVAKVDVRTLTREFIEKKFIVAG